MSNEGNGTIVVPKVARVWLIMIILVGVFAVTVYYAELPLVAGLVAGLLAGAILRDYVIFST